ncbi:MAG: hypothetical protein WAM97_18480 [Acidimicrobiales bacterium]
MWAVVITVDINDIDEAKRSLDEDLVPMVRQQAGFVGGYWIQLDGGHGTSVELFESESQAREAFPEGGSSASSPGVTITGIEVGEVIAHA